MLLPVLGADGARPEASAGRSISATKSELFRASLNSHPLPQRLDYFIRSPGVDRLHASAGANNGRCLNRFSLATSVTTF